SVTGAGLLAQVSGNTTDYVGGDNACHPLPTANRFTTKTAAYTVQIADSGTYFVCSNGSWTLTLPVPVAGFSIMVRNDQGLVASGTITISAGSRTIDGQASLALLPGQECTILTDATNYRTVGLQHTVLLGTQDLSAYAHGIVLLPAGYR